MTDATKRELSQKDAVSATPSSPARPQTARRRLMLGAAAVLPSVYTLTSGAQIAAVSTLRCWDTGDKDPIDFRIRGNHSAEEVPSLSLTHDEWLRKEVYYGVYDGSPAYCTMEDQAGCVDPANPGKAAIGSTWMVDGWKVTAGPAEKTITQISSKPQAYALVFVDQQGTIATLDPGSLKNVRPVREACWTSIIGDRASMLG